MILWWCPSGKLVVRNSTSMISFGSGERRGPARRWLDPRVTMSNIARKAIYRTAMSSLFDERSAQFS